MNMYALFAFSAVVLGSMIISIILYNHRNVSSRMLAIFLFALTYSNFSIFLIESRYILSVPFLFRTDTLILYLAGPSIFLYIVFLTRKRIRLQWTDSLHLIPAFIYLIDFLPFFGTSNDYKRQVVSGLLQAPESILYFKEGFLLPAGAHFVARTGLAIVYATMQMKLIFGFKDSEEGVAIKNDYLSWLTVLSLVYFLFSAFSLTCFLFFGQLDQWIMVITNSITMFFVVCGLLFIRPYILYRLPHSRLWPIKNEKDKLSTHSLSPDTIAELKTVFRNFVQQQHYLRNDINIKEVASELNTRPYILSAFINETYQVHFNDLINNYRIQYIKDGLSSGKWELLTLEAIAENAGFNNRTTFLTAFKKFTGLTPTQFIKRINLGRSNEIQKKTREL
jgi:AraC-like DNA-binding protein